MSRPRVTLVLGSRDPEMDAIARIAVDAQCDVVWATKDGHPVRYDEMYRADAPAPTLDQLWVECSPEGGKANGLNFVDHHQPGDPGFNRPPEESWEASSLGQVWRVLHGDKKAPDALKLIAAVDHCPHAAYSGRCRDVLPGDVVAFSAERIAISSDTSFKDTVAAIWQRIHHFKSQRLTRVEDVELFDNGRSIITNPDWLILREAALWQGIAVKARVAVEGEVWEKVAGHTTEVFIDHYIATCGLERVYGDAQRGYAGGLVPPVSSTPAPSE
jgi:hypothetical protein